MKQYADLPQIVPSALCLTCDVCCRFPEEDSFLIPYFTGDELAQMRAPELRFFPSRGTLGAKVRLIPGEEGCRCPYFDPQTHHCQIYERRPLDCRIYPFSIMRETTGQVVLGIDTKCPFIQEHAEEIKNGEERNRVLSFLTSDPILEILISNPALIGRYQEDVIPLAPIHGLTPSKENTRSMA